ncbi:hypothetical protein SHAb15599_00176 [Acinetobacter phage SH-Ab 15599]|nr:hypothetical protein SHAb15599_00176 [Acinetobacter phage SH-Ab 15599]
MIHKIIEEEMNHTIEDEDHEWKPLNKFFYRSQDIYFFRCPGCDRLHPYHTNPARYPITWNFNGDIDKPTFTPSLMVNQGDSNQCHLFMTDGKIQFLSDCHHSLAGQTVDMVELGDM